VDLKPAVQIRKIAFWIGAAAIFVVGALLRGGTMGQPMETGYHDLGIRQAVAARNFLAHGIVETRGAMILNGGPAAPDELEPYARHPPLLPLVLAGVFAAFGDTLTVYRVTHIAISLGAIALLMLILHRTHGRIVALVAGWTAAVCPMSAFYATGGDVLGEGLNLLVLAGLWFRVASDGEPRGKRFAAELFFYFLAAWYDWPGIFAFGIPLADAAIFTRSRGAFRRAALALAAGAATFGLLYAWAAFVVPARFPECRLEGAVGNWTAARLVQAYRDYPDEMRANTHGFFVAQLRLWTIPILAAAAAWIAGTLIAAFRRHGREPGARVAVLLFVPGAAFAVGLTAMFVLHHYAPIVLVPAVAAAAGTAAGAVSRFRLAGAAVVVLWAAWAGWTGMRTTRASFEEFAPAGLAEAAAEAASRSGPDGLVVTYHPTAWVLGWYARRNVVAGATSPHGNPAAEAYLTRHPGAAVIYALPPPPELPLFQPEAGKAEERVRYETIVRALEERFAPVSVGSWRLYRIL
jgi:hypothetical protein